MGNDLHLVDFLISHMVVAFHIQDLDTPHFFFVVLGQFGVKGTCYFIVTIYDRRSI